MELLTEKYADLLESEKYAPLEESEKGMMASLLEAGQRELDSLEESTVSGDVAQFTPILIPMIRKVYPALIANDLLGMQPLSTPTGYIYSMGYRYTNDSNNPIMPTTNAQILDVDAADVVGDTITGAVSGATGVVRYVEGTKQLVELTTPGLIFAVEGLAGGTNSTTANAVYSNELLFKNILKNYTGPYTTAAGEQLSTDMKEVGFDIQRKNVEAVTRKLKGKYTLEMYQDLKAQHGMLADEEIMNLMSAEIQSEMDREVLDFVNGNSTVLPDYFVWRDQTGVAGTSNDGRWEIEKYRLAGIRFSAEAREIGRLTRRGSGNTMIASSKVVSMLDQLDGFAAAPIGSGINDGVNVAVAGTFDRKFKVIQDVFAANDYATIMYKGADRRDGLGYFSPYSPLSFQRTVIAESGQPAIIAATRYALSTNPQNPEFYSRTMGIRFEDSILGA